MKTMTEKQITARVHARLMRDAKRNAQAKIGQRQQPRLYVAMSANKATYFTRESGVIRL